MRRAARAALAVSFLAVGLAAMVGAAGVRYLDGPPPRMTGGFGEANCSFCHFDNPVDDGAGEVRVTGFPERYEPGRTYRVVVEVWRPGLTAGGFQVAVRYAPGAADAGKQAGELRATDSHVAVRPADSVSYVQHTPDQPKVRDGAMRWEFDWTAPVRAGDGLVLHAAGNAANGDNSEFGDYIYLAELVSRVRR
jgi:hypothetical protein